MRRPQGLHRMAAVNAGPKAMLSRPPPFNCQPCAVHPAEAHAWRLFHPRTQPWSMLDVHQTLAPHNRNSWMSTHMVAPQKSRAFILMRVCCSQSACGHPSMHHRVIHTTPLYTEPQSHSGVMGAAPEATAAHAVQSLVVLTPRCLELLRPLFLAFLVGLAQCCELLLSGLVAHLHR